MVPVEVDDGADVIELVGGAGCSTPISVMEIVSCAASVPWYDQVTVCIPQLCISGTEPQLNA